LHAHPFSKKIQIEAENKADKNLLSCTGFKINPQSAYAS